MSDSTLPSLDDLQLKLRPATRQRWFQHPWARGGLLLAAALLLLMTLRVKGRREPVRYSSVPVTREDLRVTVRSTGSLQALTTVEVGAEVSGRVLGVLVDVNDVVRKGQVLAEIDPKQMGSGLDQARAQVQVAEAAIRQAEASLEESNRNLDRNQRLWRSGILAQADLDASRSSQERAVAALRSTQESWRSAKASLDQAASQLGKTRILAPIDGVVLSRLVEPGQTVNAGFQTPLLFKLAQDLRKMRLNVDIDEADVSRIKAGQGSSFTVAAYPGRTFPATVDSLQMDPKIAQNVVTYRAVLKVENGSRALLPGMTCTATIQTEAKLKVLVVPNAALRFLPAGNGTSGLPGMGGGKPNLNDGRHRVWVLKEGQPEPIEVTLGSSDGRLTEIVAGQVVEGQEVLTDLRENS